MQYILGDWDFHGLTLELEPPVFIPRPETEELVELVLAGQRESSSGVLSLLDFGCGGGAIGLALLHQLEDARCVGVDINPAAVSLARRNAERCGLTARYEAHT